MVSTRRGPQDNSLIAGGLAEPAMAHVTVSVGGLTCASDAVRLERHIRRSQGVIDVVVNPITDRAYITIDRTRTTPEAIRRWVDASVYGPATR
jgi:Cu+-exporting ATPase